MTTTGRPEPTITEIRDRGGLRGAMAFFGPAFVAAIAYVDPDPQGPLERVFEGRCSGSMAPAPRGDGGFGYDPVFLPAERSPGGAGPVTMAELSDEQKDAISHRGHATRALLDWLTARPTAG